MVRQLRNLAVCLALALSAAAEAQVDVPPLSGRVVDRADVLASHVEDGLTQRLAQFEDSTSAQVVVLTIPSLQGAVLEEYATLVFRTWGLGRSDADNGVLLLVARDDRELRIEVGFGLEGDLTDATAGQIIRTVIVPRFKEGDFDSGVLMGVEAILGSIEGTYIVPEGSSGDEPDGFIFFVMVGFPVWTLLVALRNGIPGRDGDLAMGFFGALTGTFIGLAISIVSGDWLWMGLILLVPLLVIPLNRFLEAHPRFGPNRRKRRRKSRLIAKAQRAGKTNIVIDGVSYRVPSASSNSGGGFSGGGGSSGGGGASGSW